MLSMLAVTSKCKLFVCNLIMKLNELKLHICLRIGIDSTTRIVNLSFKYRTTDGKILEYLIDDDEALEAMSEHSSLRLFLL